MTKKNHFVASFISCGALKMSIVCLLILIQSGLLLGANLPITESGNYSIKADPTGFKAKVQAGQGNDPLLFCYGGKTANGYQDMFCPKSHCGFSIDRVTDVLWNINSNRVTIHKGTSQFDVMVKPSEIFVVEKSGNLNAQCSWDLSSGGKLPLSVTLPQGYALELEGAEIWKDDPVSVHKTEVWVWILAGIGGLVVIGLILGAIYGLFKYNKKKKEAQKIKLEEVKINPTTAAPTEEIKKIDQPEKKENEKEEKVVKKNKPEKEEVAVPEESKEKVESEKAQPRSFMDQIKQKVTNAKDVVKSKFVKKEDKIEQSNAKLEGKTGDKKDVDKEEQVEKIPEVEPPKPQSIKEQLDEKSKEQVVKEEKLAKVERADPAFLCFRDQIAAENPRKMMMEHERRGKSVEPALKQETPPIFDKTDEEMYEAPKKVHKHRERRTRSADRCDSRTAKDTTTETEANKSEVPKTRSQVPKTRPEKPKRRSKPMSTPKSKKKRFKDSLEMEREQRMMEKARRENEEYRRLRTAETQPTEDDGTQKKTADTQEPTEE